MTQVNIKYGDENFGHSIDICELGNSLIWFWSLMQTIGKECGMEKVDVKANATSPGSFSLMTDIVIPWASIAPEILSSLSNLVAIVLSYIEMKKALKWEAVEWIEVVWNWTINIYNNKGSINITQTHYNIYEKNKRKIDKELEQFVSPLQNIGDLNQISLWWEWVPEWTKIEKVDAPFFEAQKTDVDLITDRVVSGVVKEINRNTNKGLFDFDGKQLYMDFRPLIFNQNFFSKLCESLEKSSLIYVKGDIEYGKNGIPKRIQIKEVVDPSLFEFSE